MRPFAGLKSYKYISNFINKARIYKKSRCFNYIYIYIIISLDYNNIRYNNNLVKVM